MGIRSLSTASISTGTKRSKVWDQSATTTSFESIATVALSSGQSLITFSSIPQTYKHLQLIAHIKTGRVADGDGVNIRLNGDTGANYSGQYIYANGNATFAGDYGNLTSGMAMLTGSGTNANCANIFGGNVIDIFDYSNVNKFTHANGTDGYNLSSTNINWLASKTGIWRNKAAVTNIVLWTDSGQNFSTYSHFSLYGIKG
jgi:hypothetical protein